MYEIILSKRVERFLDKLDSKNRERIILSLDKLEIRPESYLKRLVRDKSYKFRVKDFRLVIDIKNNKLLVIVGYISHKKTYTKDKLKIKLCEFQLRQPLH